MLSRNHHDQETAPFTPLSQKEASLHGGDHTATDLHVFCRILISELLYKALELIHGYWVRAVTDDGFQWKPDHALVDYLALQRQCCKLMSL